MYAEQFIKIPMGEQFIQGGKEREQNTPIPLVLMEQTKKDYDKRIVRLISELVSKTTRVS